MIRTIDEILAQADEAQARIQEIHALITGEINNDANLSDLRSPSQVADFKLWKEAFSTLSYLTENLWEEAKRDLQRLGTEGIAANAAWFAREFKKFQFGDALLFDNVTARYSYAVLDPTKQIIKRLSIVKGVIWQLKAATEDEQGNPIPLTLVQREAFEAYVDRLQPPGPAFQVISIPGDLLDARFRIFYNALLSVDDVRPLVEQAYLDYIAQIDIEAESTYFITRHVDALQAVPGINDVREVSIQAREATGAYAPVERSYSPFSGYLLKDPAISFATLLTYEAVLP